jgi:hypothetical protein
VRTKCSLTRCASDARFRATSQSEKRPGNDAGYSWRRTAWPIALLSLLLVLALPAVVQAQFNYTTDNGTITITGYTGPGGAVAIPDTINGLPVTRIGDHAFYDKTSLTSVTIGDGVTSIEGSAFSSCTSLTSVTIPNSLTTIGEKVFYYCRSLTGVMIPNGVTSIGGSAFSYCINLTSVTIPNSVTSIGEQAFYYCRSLTSVMIPNGVTSIGDAAFYSCTSLRAITVDALNSFYSSVDGVLFNKSQTVLLQCPAGKVGSYTIPNGVTGTAYYAFQYCTSLTDVTIPNSVTGIGDAAFADCTSLRAITVDALNSVYSSVDGVLFNKTQTLLIQLPAGKAGSYTIPNSVTSIGEGAFSFCYSLTNVTIPNSVTGIGDHAFTGCSSLTSVTIPNSVTSIGRGAFSFCYSLTSVTMPDRVTSIGDSAFSYCSSLTSVTIPSGVTSIGDSAFSACTSLTNVTIPNSVTSLGDSAFGDSSSLSGVYFQGNSPNADEAVFLGANNVTVCYLPGTTGWETTFGGRPTAPWLLQNPLILGNGPRFGVQFDEVEFINVFGFVISWATNASVVLEAATDLANPDWIPVGTNTLTDGVSYFSDPQWTNHPARFYRLRSP